MSKYLITLEVESDTDPAYWNYDYLLNLDENENYQVIHTEQIEEVSK